MPAIPLNELQPNRIALIKPSALGDVVHSLPVLTALRRRWPAANITWVINRAYEPLVAGHPDLNATLAFDRGALKRGTISAVKTIADFARQLRRGDFDLVIDLQGLLRTGLMSRLTGAKRRIGSANAREGAARFYTDRVEVPDANEIHAVDRYWRVVQALGAGDGSIEFTVPISEAARRTTNRRLRDLPRPWLVIAPGARWTTKRWPAENFAAIANRSLVQFGGTIILVGSADDREAAIMIATSVGDQVLNLVGETSLPVLAAVLDCADAVLANDSGPLHLAAALGRPCIAPYTCTLVRKHGPYGQFHRTASADVACRGSYLRVCDHMSCMPTLPPDRVFPLLVEALSTWKHRQSA